MEILNNTELNAAKLIINQGFSKAAESLSFFMKEKIRFNELSFSVNKVEKEINFTAKQGQNIHLLITNVIGELKGVCFLIFSEEEANKLRQTALPKEVLENPAMMSEMSDAIMLEVDNIISASVITQFSNILQHKIYGGVPELKKLNSKQLSEYISGNFEQDAYFINFKTQLASSSLNFNPEFVWLLDNTFLNSIKTFALDSAKVSQLEAVI